MTDENTKPKTTGTEPTVPDWLIPSRVYDILKWLGILAGALIGVSAIKQRLDLAA